MLNHKGMTPMEARRRGLEKPGEAKSADGMTRPHDQEEMGEDHNGSDNEKDGMGDGMHHHEMHGPDDAGMWTSKHTHPDGKVEHGEHSSYSDAVEHMHNMHGEHAEEMKDGKGEDEEGMDHSEPDGDEPEDLAGMYASD